MLERLAAWFLNTYVAEYVGNLNTDQLSIALLQGAVELEKLPLKRDALRKLKLPIDIKTGFIGKLKIEIPLTRIQSQAWVLHIEDLYLVAGPSQLSEYDKDEEDAKLQAWKEKKLKSLEEKWRDEMQKGSWWCMFSMPTTFLANIVHNIQIVVNNIHVRYEDSEACPSSPFAVGITVENISAQTTNDSWEPQFVSEASKQKKLFDCRNLAVYWDTNLVGDTESGPELMDLLDTLAPTASTEQEIMGSSVFAGHRGSSYIINPVNGQIRLTYNRTPRALTSANDGPRLGVEILLDDVSVSLTELQYHSFLNLADELQLKARATKVARWRPKATVLENPAAWWQFAYVVAQHKLEQQRRRKTWKYVLERAKLNVNYVRIYVLKLTNQTVNEESQEFLTSTERDLSFDDLYLLRVIAMGKAKQHLRTRQQPSPATSSTGGGQNQSFLERWLPGWSSSYLEQGEMETSGSSGSQGTEGQPTLQKQQSIREEDEFLQALGFEDRSQALTRDRKFVQVSFSLNKGSLKLLPSPKFPDPFQCEPILELKFSSLRSTVDVSPKVKETTFSLSLGSIHVVDHQNIDSLFPFILQSRIGSGDTGSTSSPLIKVDVKRETVKHRPVWSIKVHSKPLDVVLHSTVVHQLRDFFTRRDQFGLALDWTARVRRRVRELRVQTAAELRGQIEELLDVEVETSRAKLKIDLDISAPQIIIPQSLTDRQAPVIILDLGHITCINATNGPLASLSIPKDSQHSVESRSDVEEEEDDEDEFVTPPSTPPSEEGEESTDGMSHTPLAKHDLEQAFRKSTDPYDRYSLQCADLQLLVVKAQEKTPKLFAVPHSAHHILDRFTLSVELKRKLKFSSDPLKANKLLSAQLPLLSFHLDEEKVTGLMKCLQQWVPVSHSSQDEMEDSDSRERLSESQLYEDDEPMFTSAFQSITEEDLSSDDNDEDSSKVTKKSSKQAKLAQQKKLLTKSVKPTPKGEDHVSELDLVFATSVFFDMQFTIGKVMLTVNSRGQEALKLSIIDVRAGAVKRPYDFKGKFVIGDLAIVDCIQKFGPQYELLACSSGHHLLSFSPENASLITTHKTATSPSRSESKPLGESFRNSIFLDDFIESNCMLLMEFSQLEVHSPDHPNYASGVGEMMRKVDINCEGIDIMANTGTIAEIISFVNRVSPTSTTKMHTARLRNIQKAINKTRETVQETTFGGNRVQGSFHFGRLNVCIIRGIPNPIPSTVSKDTPQLCYVVGTIAATHLRVEAEVDNGVAMTAKLSGVEVIDCTLTGKRYPVVCKVGNLAGNERSMVISPDIPERIVGVSEAPRDGDNEAVVVAFTRTVDPDHQTPFDHISVKVASIHYTHTLNFTREIQNLVSDFHLSMAGITNSLRGAAVGVAKGIVRQVTLHQIDEVSILPPGLDQRENSEIGEEPLPSSFLQFKVDVATPVVIIPKSSSSEDCLIFHLGKISVGNKVCDHLSDEEIGNSPSTTSQLYEEIIVDVSDVSIQAVSGFDLVDYAPTQELLCKSSGQKCFKIVNKLSLTLSVKRGLNGLKLKTDSKPVEFIEGWEDTHADILDGSSPSTLSSEFDFVVTGKVDDQVSLKMSKFVFEQIKSTLRHLASISPGASTPTSEESESTPSQMDSSLSTENSMSLHDPIPSFSASFLLPKLSLELSQETKGKNMKFVFVVMKDFAVQASKHVSFETNFDLQLGSFVIEDLLQSEESNFRYIFLTSTKLLPNASLMPASLRKATLRGMSGIISPPSFATPLYSKPTASSSPKRKSSLESPLRAFSRNKTTVEEVNKVESVSEQGLLSRLDNLDLFISITGLLVSESSPDFVDKYESASIHLEADFSAASITINLQTWVLLLDFLGIGTPTPPPSPTPGTTPIHVTPRMTTPSPTSPISPAPLTSTRKSMESSIFIQSLIDRDAEMFYSIDPKATSQGTSTTQPTSSTPDSTKTKSSPPGTDLPHLESSSDVNVWGDETKRKMKLFVHFQSLDVTFNKTKYPLAKGTVSGLNVTVKVEKGNVEAEGGLDLISVVDLTEKGHYYRERFATTGQHALKFKIFKYGKPDPNLERPFDFSVDVELGSLRYIHTMRFLKEALAFCMHFPQLIEAFQRMKELAKGTLVYEGPKRKPRILFKVDAEEAYLLIPRHAEDPYLIVGDIGQFTVRNQFKYDGEEGTYSHRHKLKTEPVVIPSPMQTPTKINTSLSLSSSPATQPTGSESGRLFTSKGGNPGAVPYTELSKGPCLLDCIEVKLMDCDVFTARRVPIRLANGDKSFRIVREPGNVLKDKSALDLFVERNLHENFCRSVPDLLVDGVLQKTHVLLDKQQLELVKGLIDKNLGEPIEQFETPNTVIKDPVGPFLPSERWTTFLFNIKLINVQLDFLQSRVFLEEGTTNVSIARADIEDSNFSFEAFSDQCKKVDFLNRCAVGYDTRYEDYEDATKPNAFVEVLRPRRSDKARQKKSIQVEIHVVISPEKIDASILFHKVRIMGVLDLILELKAFIFDSIPDEDHPFYSPLPEDSIEDIDGSFDPLFKSTAHPHQISAITEGDFVSPVMLATIPEEEKPPRTINVKFNMTETDIVLVEDLAKTDSSAVILKGTLLFKFAMSPDKRKNINCIIENLELFSCSLVNEEGTALSILEPITADLEVKHPQNYKKIRFHSLSESSSECSFQENAEDYFLQVQLPDIRLKFSYRDLKMFAGIVQSLSRMKTNFVQRDIEYSTGTYPNSPSTSTNSSVPVRLTSSPEEMEEQDDKGQNTEGTPFRIGGILVDLSSVDVCIIDDCHYQNVPVVKFNVIKVQAQNYLHEEPRGELVAVLSGEYFNRTISQWEPLVEDWGFRVKWKKQNNFHTDIDSNVCRDRLEIKINSKHQLLFNLTSSLIQLLKITYSNWSQDLFGNENEDDPTPGPPSIPQTSLGKVGKGLAFLHSVGHLNQQSKRETFVPYLLKNNTGLPLSFAMMTSLPSVAVKIGTDSSTDTAAYLSPTGNVKGHSLLVTSLDDTSEWREIPNGGEAAFDFKQSRKAVRQRRTNDLIVHQILVQVEGWKRITFPVSVDKVGVVFREIYPEDSSYPGDELPQSAHPLRLVFAVSLSNAQKVINVRSSLILHNTTEIPFEVKIKFDNRQALSSEMESTAKISKSVELRPVAAGGHTAVPINLLNGSVYVRPMGWGVRFSSSPMEWRSITKPGLLTGNIGTCESIGGGEPFLFCSCVVREGFPPDVTSSPSPAHTITLYPPVVIVNLLPYDICFYTSRTDKQRLIRKGENLSLYNQMPDKTLEFMATLEDYPQSDTCKVSLSSVGILQKLTVYDAWDRPLVLTVECVAKGKQAIEVLISCPFWLINDTGLSLVFRQDKSASAFANQSVDHEKATNRQPLLFSYSDVGQGDVCAVRLGKETHSAGKPKWTPGFSMLRGPGVQRLFWSTLDSRPDREYQVGMDIYHCRGSMRHTRIVTFVPHYKLENRTNYELSFLQRFQIFMDSALEEKGRIITAKPGAIVTFHWPRFDKDQLLCVRLKDIPDCQWSGGFTLINNGCICLNLRSGFGRSIFLRVETINKDATSYVIFSEAVNTPLPFRLENFSQMKVLCHQTKVFNENCQYYLNPGQSVHYAWDEPDGEKSFSVKIVGVRTEEEDVVFKPDTFGTLGHLYYENYIYIGAPATFTTDHKHTSGLTSRQAIPMNELVLDVPQGRAVVFKQKNLNEVTQLWRMSAEGQLVHIASSEEAGTDMVLDITGDAPTKPGQYASLVLCRRTQHSRTATQKWAFKEDLLVLKESPHLCVQTKRDYQSFKEGSDVVLGFVSKEPSSLELQKIRAMKHTPGSGVLSVRLISDGPTRVLKIADANKQYTHLAPRQLWMSSVSVAQEPHPMSAPQSSVVSNYDNEEQPGHELDVEVSLAVSKGIGISVINSFPEELMFATLSGVCVDVSLNSSAQKVTLEVEHVQVDNQLVNTNFPILVYPTPNEEEETEDTLPVISASVEHVRHHLPGTTVLKHFNAHVCDLMVLMEERLLFRLIQWIQEGLASTDENMEDNAGKEAFSMLTRRTTATIVGGGGQLHFESIDLMMGVVRLSLHTTSNLPPDLRAIKHSLGVPTVTFEAPVVFDRYSQHHLSGTTQVVLESIATHYKRVVKDQSIKIAGSVDILGNPTGLMSDIASGVSGMFSQNPDILGFVRDVSHGIFDSTSKITGSASYILGQASFDSSYQDEREQMSNTCQTSSDHLSAGLIGLSSGIFGGLTSMVTQPYYGMVNEGIGGFFAGLGKGVAGTITKPVAGLFDFASNTSAALRETTSRISKVRPERLRPKRCCVDPSGALVPYQPQMARAQLYLRILKEQADDEMLVAYEHISNDGTRALISSNFVYFFKQTPPSPTDVEAKIDLELLHHCRDTISKGDKGDRAPIIVLSVQLSQALMQTKTFKFRCKSESLARNVSRLINYAKTVHEYRKTVVQTFRLQVQNIW